MLITTCRGYGFKLLYRHKPKMKPPFLIPNYEVQCMWLPLNSVNRGSCKHAALLISEDAGLLGTFQFYSWGLHDISKK